jgi:nucleoside-diphosphate-sugar epimerase
MKILLTGSNGFLGQRILSSINNGLNIVSTLNRSNSNYNFDISVESPIFTNPFDLVIHNAGKAHFIPKNDLENQLFFDTNVKGTINLLSGLSTLQPPKQVIFISSVSVYGLSCGENINELTPLKANDAYGISKIMAEEIIEKWCKERNVICTIFRLPLIVGNNPPGNLGAMIKGIKNNYYFNVAGGNAQKSMVLATDVANLISKVVNIAGIYNLTDGVHPTFDQLSSIISSKFNKSFTPNLPFFIAKIFAKFGDLFGESFPINSNKLKKITSTLTFDDSKARISFGWNPIPVIDEFKLYENV